MKSIESGFRAFFRAVNGFDPYRWQVRLVHEVAESGMWPENLSAPTGAGKTAIIEAALFLNALIGLGKLNLALPRRLCLAVNRRALVDSQYIHALDIQSKLKAAEGGVLAEVAAGLRHRWGDVVAIPDSMAPFAVVEMRGGCEVSIASSWRMYPEAVAVICATPDMFGSRLLFRGYGVSRRMRPVEAGLLAYDTLLVVDESHLNMQLVKTAQQVSRIEGAFRKASGAAFGVKPLQVCAMSATLACEGPVFRLGDKDEIEADATLRRRIRSPKIVRTAIAQGKGDDAAVRSALLEECLKYSGSLGGVTAVIVNSVSMAISLAECLRAEVGGLDRDGRLVVVTGRMRPSDRKHALNDILRLSSSESAKPSFIIGTQALEVGIDYDSRSMVSEIAPVSALVQRMGRLNRFGRYDDGEFTVVCGNSRSPYSQEELEEAKKWLRSLPDNVTSECLACDPPVFANLRGRTVLQRLEPWDVKYLAHTSEALSAESSKLWKADTADLALWIRDDLEPDMDTDVYIVVRELPTDARLACMMMDRIPPRDEELFPCDVSNMRKFLDYVANGALEPPAVICVKAPDGEFTVVEFGESAPLRIAPGFIFAVSPDARMFLSDVALPWGFEIGELRASRSVYTELLEVSQPGHLPFELNFENLNAVADDVPRELSGRLSLFEKDLAALERNEDYVANLRSMLLEFSEDLEAMGLESRFAQIVGKTDVCVSFQMENGDWPEPIMVCNACLDTPASTKVEFAGAKGAVGLAEHQEQVSSAVDSIASQCGLPEMLCNALAAAGLHHDDGKAEPLFQRLLDPDANSSGGLLAKSIGEIGRGESKQRREGLGLRGWRHEQLSAAMMLENGDVEESIRSLVVRLVGTSHGYGRGTFEMDAQGLSLGGKPLDAAVLLFDTGLWEAIVAESDARYGVWAMAYLEAVLRAADCRISAKGAL